jgi:hypothetical protein
LPCSPPWRREPRPPRREFGRTKYFLEEGSLALSSESERAIAGPGRPGNAGAAYFDQGLRLYQSFNLGEATSAFEEADSSIRARSWRGGGLALAAGPNDNSPIDEERNQRAVAAMHKAGNDEATDVKKRFDVAWRNADVKQTASSF